MQGNPSPRGASGPATAAERLFLEHLPYIQQVIDYICRRHRFFGDEAQEFASIVKLKLIEDDYGILRKFRGQGGPRTYLTVVIQNLFLAHRNRLWGRFRPSAEARRLGRLALDLEVLTVRDGLGLAEATGILCNRHPAATPEQLAALMERLPVRAPRRTEGEETLAVLTSTEEQPDDAAMRHEREGAWERLQAALGRALAGLPDEDRLIVRLRMEEGLQFVEIARALRVEVKPLYRRMEGILKQLRRELERQGVGREEVQELLGSGDRPPQPGAPAPRSVEPGSADQRRPQA